MRAIQKSKAMILFFAGCLSILVAGCGMAIPRYSISMDNVTALRAYRGTTVSVGQFSAATPAEKEILCRLAATIRTPDGESYEEFIRKAFIDELKVTELYSAGAPVTLTGHVDQLDFSSTSGVWEIALTLKSSNGRTVSVKERYNFGFVWMGDQACNEGAKAFVPAVQNLVSKVIRHDNFSSLLR